MFPEEFISRIRQQPYLDTEGLTEALHKPAEASIRVNRHKWPSPVTGYESVRWEPDGYYIPGRPLFTPDPLFHAGIYYPQESSSMFTGEVFRQLAGDMRSMRVLDLCGAPGGKSTHLSAILDYDSLLVSNEVIGSRAAILAENITKWGVGNTIVTQNDPSRFASLPGFFDIVVIDAPCSGEGMFRSPLAVKEWSVANTRLCSERQRRIVMESWPALKPGGILIYSTCTFNPGENEENIEWIKENTGSESLEIDITGMEEITTVEYRGITGYGFFPGRVRGNGFFTAALRKPGDKGTSVRMTGRKSPALPSRLAGRVNELVSSDIDRLIMVKNRVIALAAGISVFNHIREKLTVVKSGTLIGDLKNDLLVPAHDLAMSVRHKPGAWPEYNMTPDEATAFLRHEQVNPAAIPAGRVLMRYRGVPLGFGNNLGSRLNNGYPQAWRMRMDRPDNYSEIL
jgi:16S rRNA C967 or C1407 C5-methylase (RsmB/RsmF family)/NOL1/NOP2/fmu family ribosome biogenesis protein